MCGVIYVLRSTFVTPESASEEARAQHVISHALLLFYFIFKYPQTDRV